MRFNMKEHSTDQGPGTSGNPKRWLSAGAVSLWGSKVNLWFVGALVLLTFTKLFLVRGMSLAIRPHTIDDLLFVQLAQSIARGEWLGPYTLTTLFKGPGYPLWLAMNYMAGWRLLLTQQVLYIIACLVTVVSVRSLFRRNLALLVLYAILLFAPQSFDSDSLGVQRENLYAPLGILVFACLAGIVASSTGNKRRLALWSLGLGCSLSLFWITREEGVFVVPSIALVFAYAVFQIWRSGARNRPTRLCLLAIPLLMTVATDLGVRALNYKHYGVFEICELKRKPFLKAYGALLQLGNADASPPMLLSAQTQKKLYAASPAFAELRPHFEALNAEVRSRVGDGAALDKDEFMGYWLVLFLWRTVSLAGYYSSPDAAAAYYERLVAELNAAYEQGLIESRPTRASLWPPWRPEYATKFPMQFLISATRLASLYDCQIEFVSRSWGAPQVRNMFEEITGEKAGVVRPGGEARPRRWEEVTLTHVKTLYRILTPPLAACAVLSLFVTLAIHVKRRRVAPLTILSLALFFAICTRLVVFSYMHISMGNGSATWRYYVPLFPLLVLFTFLSIAECAALFRSTSPSKES